MTATLKVVWSESAYRDLADIVQYIAKDSPTTARTILTKIKQTVAELYHSPLRGRFVPELQEQGILFYRQLVIPPWRVLYRVAQNTVLVVAVFDSRQNVEDILFKKLTQPQR